MSGDARLGFGPMVLPSSVRKLEISMHFFLLFFGLHALEPSAFTFLTFFSAGSAGSQDGVFLLVTIIFKFLLTLFS